MRTSLLAASAALIALAPLAANAQDIPSYAQQTGGDEQIRGRVVAFDGAFAVTVRDDRGFIDNVELHQGTIINPTGITIAPGMVVSILGYNGGSSFAANEVDTPYSVSPAYYGGQPYYAGHPWNYYGPTVGFDFFFGNVGWWHGNDFDGGYHYERGARIYENVNVTNIYRDGAYRGRDYVAPAEHGGYVPRRAYLQGDGGFAPRTNRVYAPQPTNVYAPQRTNREYAPQTTNVYAPQRTNVYAPQRTSVYAPQRTNAYAPQRTNVYAPHTSEYAPPSAGRSYQRAGGDAPTRAAGATPRYQPQVSDTHDARTGGDERRGAGRDERR